MRKLFCYVDESGQHTIGKMFVVSVVIAERERDNLLLACERIEKRTGKNRTKWIKTKYGKRIEYIREIIDCGLFVGKIYFENHPGTKNYTGVTVETISKSVLSQAGQDNYKASVFIDGLHRKQEMGTAVRLRRMGVRLRKVKGARDQSNALIRLADAICGLVVGNMEGEQDMVTLYKMAQKTGLFGKIE